MFGKVSFLALFLWFCVCLGDDLELLKKEWCKEENCYDLLGVNALADFREIKSAYNNISLKLHPDKNPNATSAEKELYVRVNRAYEVLSNPETRRDYDKYLSIKSSLDAPRENLFLILILLYGVATFVVLQYQKQSYKNLRDSVLGDVRVQKWFREKYDLDLSGRKSSKKSRKGKKGKGKKGGSKSDELSASASLLLKTDPTTASSVFDEVSDAQITEAIGALNLHLEGWNKEQPKPELKDAAMAIPNWFVWAGNEALFQVQWTLRYKVMKQPLSEEDRQYLCRSHFKLSQETWDQLPSDEKESYLEKPGKWRKGLGSQNLRKRR